MAQEITNLDKIKDDALFVVKGTDGNNYKITGAQFKNLIDPKLRMLRISSKIK